MALLYRKVTQQGFLLLGFYKDQLCFRLIIGLKWCVGYLIVSRVLPMILVFLFISEGKFNQNFLGQSLEPSGNIAKQLEYIEESAGMLSLWFVISYLVFFKVLFEEFIFRGLLYGPIRRKIGPWAAMLVSSLLFTLAHGSLHPFLLIPGFLFAYLYEQTQSLIPSVVFHGIVSLVSVIEYFYVGTALSYFQFQTQIAGMFLGLIILFILLEWLFRVRKHNGATLRIPDSILQLSYFK